MPTIARLGEFLAVENTYLATFQALGAIGLLLGALGLAAGLLFRPLGVSAAIGLVLFFVCAIYTHIRASDYSPQFALAIGFLGLNVAALALSLPSG